MVRGLGSAFTCPMGLALARDPVFAQVSTHFTMSQNWPGYGSSLGLAKMSKKKKIIPWTRFEEKAGRKEARRLIFLPTLAFSLWLGEGPV